MTTPEVLNVPVPPGATAYGWNMVDEWGDLVRALNWSKHDGSRFGISIDGEQFADGSVTRSITVCANATELTGAEARAVAAALIEAADKYDQLEKAHPIVREET